MRTEWVAGGLCRLSTGLPSCGAAIPPGWRFLRIVIRRSALRFDLRLSSGFPSGSPERQRGGVCERWGVEWGVEWRVEWGCDGIGILRADDDLTQAWHPRGMAEPSRGSASGCGAASRVRTETHGPAFNSAAPRRGARTMVANWRCGSLGYPVSYRAKSGQSGRPIEWVSRSDLSWSDLFLVWQGESCGYNPCMYLPSTKSAL